jgi:cytohesin
MPICSLRSRSRYFARRMVSFLTVLCVVIHAECRMNAFGKDFLKKALHSKKSALEKMVTWDGWTPLGVASQFGCSSHLKDLVKAGCDINALDMRNMTALCTACHFGQPEAVDELLQLGAAIEVSCGEQEVTALVNAAGNGHAEVVGRMLRAGAQVNAQGKYGGTALYFAALGGYTTVIELLLEAGGDPNLGGTLEIPLCAAASRGPIEAVRVLVSTAANLEARCLGRTPLQTAAFRNNTGVVKVLVEAGAEVDVRDDGGGTPLHDAATRGNVEMLHYLKAAGSWVDALDNSGRTVLHCAVLSGKSPAVKEVLSWGAIDVDARANGRLTPLHLAATKGFLKVAEVLIEAGADVNAVMEEEPGVEATVLELAALNDRPAIVRLLLKLGAEVDPSGKIVIVAAWRKCHRAVKVLLQARNWPDEVRRTAETLVHRKAEL